MVLVDPVHGCFAPRHKQNIMEVGVVGKELYYFMVVADDGDERARKEQIRIVPGMKAH